MPVSSVFSLETILSTESRGLSLPRHWDLRKTSVQRASLTTEYPTLQQSENYVCLCAGTCSTVEDALHTHTILSFLHLCIVLHILGFENFYTRFMPHFLSAHAPLRQKCFIKH